MTKARDFKFGYCYHITGRGNQKNDIFLEISDYKYLTKLLYKYTNLFEVPLPIYCLLPNHYHIALQCLVENRISRTMHMINTSYTYYMRKKYKWVGHVFQYRYHSKEITDKEYFITTVRYIEENPVKAKLSKSFEEYPWGDIDRVLVEKLTQVYELMRRQ